MLIYYKKVSMHAFYCARPQLCYLRFLNLSVITTVIDVLNLINNWRNSIKLAVGKYQTKSGSEKL